MSSKQIVVCLTFLLAMFAGETLKAQTLVIWQKDKSKVYYSLDERPKTTFTETDLIITTKSTTINYPLSSVLRYTYEGGSVGIDEARNENVSITQKGDDITIVGLTKGMLVNVYGTDGKLVMSRRSNGNGNLFLSLSNLPKGVYVIKANTINYKILRR